MGRGLSELQQFILVAGLAGRESKETHTLPDGRILPAGYGCDLRHAKIMSGFYGFALAGRDSSSFARHHFSVKKIGPKQYAAAHAAISRAATRLAERGLVVCVSGYYARWAGVNLTDKGAALAAELSVKTRQNSANV